jgi:DNA-binding SARP family transcriptional activator/tetratricopeptide (TPR) repeat protein
MPYNECSLMTLLRTYLFQNLQVITREDDLLDLGSPTTQSLFAYLILNRDHPSDRRRLAFLFWPRATESAARRNLRQYLHRLRRALEAVDPQGDWLLTDPPGVQLNPETELWVDVEVFRSLIRADAELNELKAAVDLYSGDLLEDIYEDWCAEERLELHNLYLSALERLSQGLQSQNKFEEAISFIHKWIASEPYDENAHRTLLSCTVLSGDRNRAILHYLSLQETLARELNTAPLPETQALFNAIQQGTYKPGQPLTPPPPPRQIRQARPPLPLVGRQNELNTLHECLESARKGSGRFILVTGESGIGKTRLIQEYLANHPNLPSLQSVCHELEANVAFSPIRQALEQAGDLLPNVLFESPPAWLVTLAYLAPSIAERLPYLPSPGRAAEESPRLREALTKMVFSLIENNASLDGPVHLILDDLHWSDGLTWDFLVHLSRHGTAQPLLIIGLCRIEDLPRDRIRLLRVLERNELVQQIPLSRLTMEETTQLSRHLLKNDPLDPLFYPRLYRETEGNPFFVIETVRAMQETGRTPSLPLETSIKPYALGIPLSIQRVIEARLDQLSAESQELLATAAAIGRAFSFSILEEISQVAAEDAIPVIEEWMERGLVRESLHSYDFSHDKIRQVAYTNLSHARRQFVHRRIAEVLENTIPPAEPATLAYHYSRSDQPVKALPHLTQAGEQALHVRSYREAHQFGLQAISLLGRMPGPQQRSERIELNLQLAQAYAFTGDLPHALEILTETEHLATALGQEARLGNIFRRLSQIFWLRGQPEVAGDYARRALRVAEEQKDSNLLGASLRMLGRVGIALSAFDDAIAYLLRYVNLEVTVPPPDLPIILGYLGNAYGRVGSWQRGLEAAQRGLTMAEAEGSRQTVAFARMQLGFVYADNHQWKACLETLQNAHESLKSSNNSDENEVQTLTPALFMLLSLRGRALGHSHQSQQGIEIIRTALEWAEENDYRVFHYLPRIFLAECLNLNKQYARGREEAERALENAREAGNRWAAGIALRILAESLYYSPVPDWTLIEEYLIESMYTLRQVRARPDLARTYLALRRLYDRAGQIAWAVDCHFRATTIFEELNMNEELREAQGQASGERQGAVVISSMRLKGPNIRESADGLVNFSR